ncbi:transposase [Nocardia sp. NBC_01730]|nr:transposase [Nocardia sp. NBC_01730]
MSTGLSVPDEVAFATKATLAKQMLARALDAGVPARWVTAEEAYGGDYKFRTWLEERRIGYVVAVPRSQTIPVTAGCTRADHLVAQAPSQAWKRLSCGAGAKGPRMFDWAVARCRPTRGQLASSKSPTTGAAHPPGPAMTN